MTMNKKILFPLTIIFVLFGCSTDMSDLHKYVADTKDKFQGTVDPLPQFKPPEIYAFRSDRDPFAPLDAIERKELPTKGEGAPPDRPLEPLEYFPLDSLSMVGTLNRGGVRWGLIKDAEGKIHRVTNNNHIGQNYGAITDVTASSISITELIQDSSGLWAERVSQLHIGE